MKKQTLQFYSFEQLASFSKMLSYGYLMNTNRMTLTSAFDTKDIDKAVTTFKANVVETNDKTFTY